MIRPVIGACEALREHHSRIYCQGHDVGLVPVMPVFRGDDFKEDVVAIGEVSALAVSNEPRAVRIDDRGFDYLV